MERGTERVSEADAMKQVIVVGVDRSARSRPAVEWAAREAVLRDLPLCVVHVAPPGGPDAPRPETVAAALAVDRCPTVAVESVRLTGEPGAVLLERGVDAAMTVLGLRGEGRRTGLTPGSTARVVAGSARCPVVLVPAGPAPRLPAGPTRPPLRPPAGRPYQVLAAVDADDPADGAVDFAFDTARLHGARLHALYAGPPPLRAPGPAGRATSAARHAARAERELLLLTRALRHWREKYPAVRVFEDVVLLDPARALIRASHHADLMVVGRGGRGGLGPVAYAVARHTACPLAVVPA
ncbi:universal stress protein [Streptomyces sp. NPDC000987]|uniref:universal stress protein n=1 Tax=Streptomyces sp. NPDC000987 TaxID=3154374 RepID=UPI003318D589